VKKLFDMRLETRYRTVRNQVSEFLDVSTYTDLRALIMDEKLQQQASKRACPALFRLVLTLFQKRVYCHNVVDINRIASAL